MVIKRLFLPIDLILIALALYLGVRGVYGYISLQLDTTPSTAAIQIKTPTKKVDLPPFSDYRIIAKRNLFNTKANGEKSSSDILLDSLKETQLKLKLWGTVAGDSDNSYAVIEDEKERKQNLYKVGDSIQNALVKMILRDKVVLSVSGKDEILEFEQPSATTSTSSRIALSARNPTTAVSATTTRRISLSRAQVDSAMGNLTELMGQINIQPNTEDGQADGMKLSNIQPNSIFRRMGLRNGDVLSAVDGQALTSVDDALKLYEDLKSTDTASVEIKRNGRSTTIEYRIR